MERTLVKSSNIRSIGYCAVTRILEVEFASGALYRHHDVPSEVHESMMAAESIGKFYNAILRGKFPHELAKESNA